MLSFCLFDTNCTRDEAIATESQSLSSPINVKKKKHFQNQGLFIKLSEL